MKAVARKAVVKTLPPQSKASLRELAGNRHFHFCSSRECRQIYEDPCESPETNELCHDCRGIRRPVYMLYRDPRECCINNTDQVLTTKDLLLFQLAGPGPWFQCRTCKRSHGWPCVV